MISVECSACGDELDEPGALLFGPLNGDEVLKLHLCVPCSEAVLAFVTGELQVEVPVWLEASKGGGALAYIDDPAMPTPVEVAIRLRAGGRGMLALGVDLSAAMFRGEGVESPR